MRAMILAAGFGRRMGTLTEQVPKALLDVGGHPIIGHQIRALRRTGITEIIINIAHLGNKIRTAIGNGQDYDVQLRYSEEPPEAPLDTGGGLRQALPLLGDEPFLVVSTDVLADFDFTALKLPPKALGHIFLVPNPPYHQSGDFKLNPEGLVTNPDRERDTLTYANAALFTPELVRLVTGERYPLVHCLHRAADLRRLFGLRYTGRWHNIGTLADLRGARTDFDTNSENP